VVCFGFGSALEVPTLSPFLLFCALCFRWLPEPASSNQHRPTWPAYLVPSRGDGAAGQDKACFTYSSYYCATAVEYFCVHCSVLRPHMSRMSVLLLINRNRTALTPSLSPRKTVGHSGAGTVPDHHVLVLPGCPRHHRGVRRDRQGVVQQRQAMAPRDRQVRGGAVCPRSRESIRGERESIGGERAASLVFVLFRGLLEANAENGATAEPRDPVSFDLDGNGARSVRSFVLFVRPQAEA